VIVDTGGSFGCAGADVEELEEVEGEEEEVEEGSGGKEEGEGESEEEFVSFFSEKNSVFNRSNPFGNL
jgi:hypothetical protein